MFKCCHTFKRPFYLTITLRWSRWVSLLRLRLQKSTIWSLSILLFFLFFLTSSESAVENLESRFLFLSCRSADRPTPLLKLWWLAQAVVSANRKITRYTFSLSRLLEVLILSHLCVSCSSKRRTLPVHYQRHLLFAVEKTWFKQEKKKCSYPVALAHTLWANQNI